MAQGLSAILPVEGSTRCSGSVVVPTTCDGATDRAKNPEDDADNGEDRSKHVKDADPEDGPDDEENDAEKNH